MFSKSSARLFLWGQDFSNFISTSITKNNSRDGHFINGEFTSSSSSSSSRKIPLSDPNSDQEIATFTSASESLVNDAINSAKIASQSGWSLQSSSSSTHQQQQQQKKRAHLLRNLASFIEEDIETLAKAESLNTGYPVKDIISSLRQSVSWMEYCANWTANFDFSSSSSSATTSRFFINHNNSSGGANSSSSSFSSFTDYESIGTVAIISSAMGAGGPLSNALSTIAPALATGNTVIWKPSELSPMSSIALAALVKEAGFPNGVFNLVQGTGGGSFLNDPGTILAKSSNVNLVSFSGRAKTAAQIKTAAAQSNFKRVISDLEDVPSIVVGNLKNSSNNNRTKNSKQKAIFDRALNCAMLAFKYGGQDCLSMCPRRLIIHESIFEEFIQRLVEEKVKLWRVGHSLDPSTNQGPMLDVRTQQALLDEIVRVTTHASSKTGETADLVFGGFAPKFSGGSGGKFVAPSCLFNVDPRTALWRNPLPGPLLCVATFSSAEEATMLSKSRFGGVRYVFGDVGSGSSDGDRELGQYLHDMSNYSDDACCCGTVFLNVDIDTTDARSFDDHNNSIINHNIAMQRRKISGDKIIGGGGQAILEQFCRRKTVVESFV